MRDWTVAVSASIDPEAAPLNVLEAMSIGLPVIGTHHGGTAEVVGSAGLLVPPRDPSALAEGIERLLADAVLHDRCSTKGPLQVAERYRSDVQLGLLVDTLEQCRGKS